MRKKLSPYLTIIITFLSLILLGSFILVSPLCLKSGVKLSYIDALFVSASAVCVTGLSTVDIASTLNIFGKIVLAILISFGGLGIVTIGFFFLSMLGIQFGVKERVLLKESLNQNSLSGLVKLVKAIFFITLIIEVFFAILYMFILIPKYGVLNGVGMSFFHSISSFNNAGFDIFESESLLAFEETNFVNIFFLMMTALEIILGGLGFIVILDVANRRKNKHFSIHTKIVFLITLILLVSATLLFKLTTPSIPWQHAVFQAVTVRTAGFNSIDFNNLNSSTIFLMDMYMFIGCSPLSTGGGIKTTTLFVIIISIYSFATGKPTIAFKRKISDKTVLKAFWVVTLSLAAVFTLSFLLLSLNDFTTEEVIFECFSAFATVGLSLGITPYLSTLSKIIICVGMFFGRLGPLTIASLFNTRWNKETEGSISYVEEKIMIG